MSKKKGKFKTSLTDENIPKTNFNSLNRFQLSLLNSGLLPAAEAEKAEGLLPSKPMEFSKFAKHVGLLRKYDVLLRIEFQVATKGESHSIRHASKEANEIKNSHKKLLPYDYNRVVLENLPGVPDSDYINASYIDGILKPNAYIATQGPSDETTADFWRMVWEKNTYIIIMLTKVFDFIKVMCVQYWPMDAEHPETYGDVEVHLIKEDMAASFWTRKFRLKKGEEEREIHQLHFTNWPSHTCPFSTTLLEFRRIVRLYMNQHTAMGPVVVHCNDGCARTGTYICIDANLELAEEDGMYDVFNYTKRLRQARKGMVESVEHYRFIYEVLMEAHEYGITWFPVSELTQRMKQKSIKSPITRQNEYQREYNKIVKKISKFTIGDCAGGHRIENRDKNRDITTVPPDNFRPYLTTFQSNETTDYINAVFVDGYLRAREFIVTEWPALRTVPDFWSLVYDHDCSCIVLLANPPPSNNYPMFWPGEREKRKKFGPVFTIDVVSFNHYSNIKSWIYRVTKKVVSLTELMAGVKGDTKTTQLFQITCWPPGHKVPTSTNAIVEVMNMVERWRQRTSYGPVVVVSTNGKTRCGVYCAASFAIEQVIEHNEVDVFGAVRTVRRHRPQLVENMTEYKYCYDLVLHYVLNYLHQE
ncbi:receptor-type tyrosine-protein phosphatase kappa-like [Centruroides sculpturatus]|uniref:receptor-type tyrosine-protein phosphatase kappa-like n=1 Tax=Centruroides sculpturatus TaxID=218467 RepID=UPI000C6EB518|nr:receptor-type tyrosine-protein phosphatase kappa-like [Centruroides sculpturatus]